MTCNKFSKIGRLGEEDIIQLFPILRLSDWWLSAWLQYLHCLAIIIIIAMYWWSKEFYRGHIISLLLLLVFHQLGCEHNCRSCFLIDLLNHFHFWKINKTLDHLRLFALNIGCHMNCYIIIGCCVKTVDSISISTFIMNKVIRMTNNFHSALHWYHNDRDGISNHQPHNCLLNCVYSCRSKKKTKFHITGFCDGNSQVISEFPQHKRPVTQKMFMFDDVIMW